jgi:hypothetical protein
LVKTGIVQGQRVIIWEATSWLGQCYAFRKNIHRALTLLFGVFPDLLVSEDFANTAENLTTKFDLVQTNCNHVLVWPSSQIYFFVSQSDTDQTKNIIIEKSLPRCVLLTSSSNMEVGEKEADQKFPQMRKIRPYGQCDSSKEILTSRRQTKT